MTSEERDKLVERLEQIVKPAYSGTRTIDAAMIYADLIALAGVLKRALKRMNVS